MTTETTTKTRNSLPTEKKFTSINIEELPEITILEDNEFFNEKPKKSKSKKVSYTEYIKNNLIRLDLKQVIFFELPIKSSDLEESKVISRNLRNNIVLAIKKINNYEQNSNPVLTQSTYKRMLITNENGMPLGYKVGRIS
jgi:hypothetical protein